MPSAFQASHVVNFCLAVRLYSEGRKQCEYSRRVDFISLLGEIEARLATTFLRASCRQLRVSVLCSVRIAIDNPPTIFNTSPGTGHGWFLSAVDGVETKMDLGSIMCTPLLPSTSSKRAPEACTGRYRVVPATRSLLSRFPPIIHGGALLKRPALSGGASPMLPKKGCSGISMPGANFAIMRCASSGIIFIFA